MSGDHKWDDIDLCGTKEVVMEGKEVSWEGVIALDCKHITFTISHSYSFPFSSLITIY